MLKSLQYLSFCLRSHPFLSVTAVALATNAIQLLIPLLEDLNIEGAEETVTVSLALQDYPATFFASFMFFFICSLCC